MPESNSDSSENDGTVSGDRPVRKPDASPGEAGSPLKKKAGHGTGKVKIAGLISTVLWIIGIALPFIIPASSPYVWLSDCFLLVGFFPLLFVWPAGWPWIVFGIMNIAIGFFLEFNKQILFYLDDSFWTPDRIAMKPLFMQTQKHVADMHPCMPWLMIGAASTVYGVIRVIKTIGRWILKLVKRS